MSLLGSWVNRGKVPPSSRYKPFGCLQPPTEPPPQPTPPPRHSSVPMPVAVFARPNSSSSVSRTSLDAGPYSLACVKPSPLRAATSPLNKRQHGGAGSRVPLLFRTNDSL